MLLALDVSGSMGCGEIAGVPTLSPRIASAAMALVTAATEREHTFVAFTAAAGGHGGKWGGGTPGITTLSISPRQRLDDVVAEVSALPMGGTDCALPMLWAQQHRVDVDTFVSTPTTRPGRETCTRLRLCGHTETHGEFRPSWSWSE